MKVTPAIKKELAQWLDTYWTTYLKGDIETWATFIQDDYRNIGGTKEEIWNSKQEIIDYTHSILDQMLGTVEIRNREIEVIPYGEYMMVNEFTDIYVKIEGQWTFYGPFRMSSLLEKTDTGWIALHQHGSYPDMKAMEGEAFSIDAMKAENARLLAAVKSRTIELEIEAALEKVRAEAMGMKKPEDLLDVCRVISDQIQQFGVEKIRNVQTAIIDEHIGQYLCYQYFTPYDKTAVEKTKYLKSPVEHGMVKQMLASRDGYFIGGLSGKELEDFRSHRKEEKHFPDPHLDEAKELAYCFLSIGEGGLGLTLYQPMTEDVLTLFKRFHQVFSLAYQRFRDIQKAEAQAREAQIEVAVEKVRAQSMAMHHPDDLDKVNKEILTQLNWLQIQGLSGVTFYLVDQDGWVKAWDFSSPGNIGNQNSYTLQFDFKKYEMMGYPFKIFAQTDLNYLVADYPLEKLEKAVFEIEEINPEVATVVKEALVKGILTHQWSACARITDGLLGIDLVSPPSEDTKTIVLKIAGAFNQAYQRFLDLQKAEAQAREAQIEAALERVRAQTMAMHNSEDVGKCVVKMFSELMALGVDEGTRFGIGILNPNNENNQLWTARKERDEVNMHIGNLDMSSHPLLKSAREAWKAQVPIHKYVLEGEDLLDYYRMLNNAPDYKIQIPLEKLPKKEIQHCFIFEHGFFYAFTHKEFQPELIHITKRFSSLFEQTYRRYLDLVRAEVQAREAQIEAALERVRSRSLAMHKTAELQSVIHTVHQELLNLNLSISGGSFIVINSEIDTELQCWGSGGTADTSDKVHIPRFEKPFYTHLLNGIKSGLGFFTEEYTREEKIDFFSFLFQHKPWSSLDSKQKEETLSALGGYTRSCVVSNHTSIFIINHFGEKFSEDENAILQRFGKVFEQTYTRFLDLQKAEAQAREAEIQLALERVRARSLAMHRSEELADISLELVKQVQTLGMESWFCAFNIYDDDPRGSVEWGSNGQGTFPQYRTPREGVFLRYFEAGQRGETLLVNEIGEEDCPAHYEYLCSLPGVGEQLLQMKAAGIPFPTSQIDHVAFFKYGYVLFITYEPAHESHDIFRRFAKVFEQTYTRFLDIQKAEEQAREAQIENALEKVRSRTMAMQRSDELTDVAGLLFNQVSALGIKTWTAGFNVWSEDNNSYVDYLSLNGEIYGPNTVHTEKAEALKALSNARKSGVEFDILYVEGEKIKELYLAISGIDEKEYDIMVKDGLLPSQQYEHFVFGAKVSVMFITYEPVPEAHDIFKRLGKVFEQTYTRFLDLQKAEAQAREAQIQLAMERVRARTMAMQHSSELGETSALLFQQIQTLGVPPWSCGFNIWEQGDSVFTSYMGSPDGAILDGFKIPLTEDATFIHFQESRDRGDKLFVDVLEGETLEAHYSYFLSLPEIKKAFEKRAQAGEHRPTFQINHLANFSHGNLMFITYEPCPQAHDIFIRFAKVFEQTYTRFLDLQKAEAQAREAQIENALEKVRSRTMAMQRSNELTDVAGLLFNQVSALGIKTWTAGFNVWSEDNNSCVDYISVNGEFIDPYTVHTEKAEALKDVSNARKSGAEFVVLYSGGEKIKQLTLATSGIDEKEYDIMLKDGLLPSQQYEHFVFGSKVSVMFLTYEPVPEAHDVFKRLGKVFEQTYTRFLDLQKAEAQAREAKIETALEKVRSRTMGMQSSEELPEVANLLFTEVRALGIHAWSCGYNILAEDKKSATCCMSSEGTLQTPFQLRLWGENSFDEMGEFVLSDHAMLVQELDGTELEEHYAYMKSFPDLKPTFDEIDRLGLSLPTYQINHLCKFTGGFILFITYEKVPESHAIFKRFTNVFDQTYTRFLDLLKAEAQAKEARIEAALERVRSRTMGMQKAEELGEVATVLFGEMNTLVDNLWTCGFVLCEKDRREDEWWLSLTNGFIEPFSLPNVGDYAHEMLYEGWEKGEAYRTVTLENEQLQEHYDWLMSIPIARQIFEDMESSGIPRPNWQRLHAAYFKTGYLVIITEVPCEEEEIFKRFAQVFDLTYTRFLDLQKAEAQARESEIQLALERVRARTMAMHKSDELSQTAAVLFEQLQVLGNTPERINLGIFKEESGTIEWWITTQEGHQISTNFFTKFEDHFVFPNMLNAWKAKEKSTVITLSGVAVTDWIRYITQQIGMPVNPGLVKEKRIISCAFFPQGLIETTTSEPLSAGIIHLLERFASVFEQAYTRFLDLQKAEKQARESQIEAALEKVRSRSLAMQSPDELIEVAQLLREEMGALGVEELETSSIYIHDENNGSTQCWFTIKNSENPGKSVTDQMTLELQDTWVGRKMLDFYRSPSNQTSVLMQGEQRIEWIRYCEEKSDLFGTSNFYGDTVPDRTYHLYKFSNGYIGAAAPGEISSESWELLKRATAVFSFAYTRFRDLQMAEANAQSALRQASLDRVRAEISSMRHTDDLDRITPLFFHELTKLGVPFIRCGVFIIQEKQEIVEAYLSSPDGNSLGVLRLPYRASELTYNTVEAWRKGSVYRQHWNKEDFVNWINQLMEQDQIQDSRTYQGTAVPPESLDLHFVPFTQGMLYVGAEKTLDEKELELVQALAKAFSIAYARYEDFVKLEQAKSEVESAMSELKSTQSQLVQQEKLASLGQLTAGIAHEIKNPLNFVNNFSEVSIELVDEAIEERSKGPEARDESLVDEILIDIKSNLQKVHEHGSRANGIVTSMLQHSRGGSGKKEPTDLNALIKEYVNLSFHGMRAGKNPIDVEIDLDLDPEIKEVSLIKEDFTRVIINLCNNAFDAMRMKTLQGLEGYQPTLTVGTSQLPPESLSRDIGRGKGGYFKISIQDNGPGIPDEIKDKILQPFFTTKKGTEGTGLGLSITHDIVKAQGGALNVSTQVGKGTTFTIELPK